jgi:hypothetical protein
MGVYLQRPPTRSGQGSGGGTAKGFGADIAAVIAWDLAACAVAICACVCAPSAFRFNCSLIAEVLASAICWFASASEIVPLSYFSAITRVVAFCLAIKSG